MNKSIFLIRSICLLVAFTACSQANREVIEKDVPILEDIVEDVIKLDSSPEVESSPRKMKSPGKHKRRRHHPSDHLMDRLGRNRVYSRLV